MIANDCINRMYNNGVIAFKIKDVKKITGISETAIRNDIRAMIARGACGIIQIKKGIYAFDKYNEFQIGCTVAKMHTNNYYIARYGAMSFNEMTEQIPTKITIFTDNYRDDIMIKGVKFRFRIRRNKNSFFGIREKDGMRWSDRVKTAVDTIEDKNFSPSFTITTMANNKIGSADIKKYFKKTKYKKNIQKEKYIEKVAR